MTRLTEEQACVSPCNGSKLLSIALSGGFSPFSDLGRAILACLDVVNTPVERLGVGSLWRIVKMKVAFLSRFKSRILAWFLDEAGHEGCTVGLYEEEDEKDREGRCVI